MKNPHIIVGEPRRCLCGGYQMLWRNPPNHNVPLCCGDMLAALERLVQTGAEDARVLHQAIQPLVQDCE